jgi:hypothetical protein
MARVYFDQDITYLRRLEEERIELVGPICEYYSLRRGKNVDPLYGEPTNDPLYGGSSPIGTPSRHDESWSFYPDVDESEPLLTMPCAITYEEMDNRIPSVREEGLIAEYDALFYVSRNAWERAITDTLIDGRFPKEGDVVYVQNEWWDITKVGTGGYALDSPNYVGFKAELRKRTKFTPDRKI